MAFDYKKEYKDLYQPKRMPAIVTVPGDPVKAMFGDKPVNEAVAAQIRAEDWPYEDPVRYRPDR